MIEGSSPLQKVKLIQNNIKSLENQIKILGRDQIRNIKSIERCFDECVPLIKSKIQESKKHFKVKRMYQQTLQSKQNRILNIKLKKYDDLRKKTNVRALIFSIKQKQASQIRDQSLKHNQTMKQQKLKRLQENNKKSEKIKNQENKVKQKIRSFYQEKIQDLSRIKKEEVNQNILRVTKSTNFMKNIENKKNSTHQMFVQTHNSLTNLRHIIKKIKCMKPQNFGQLISQTMNQSFENKRQDVQFKKNLKTLTQINQFNQFRSPIFNGNFTTEQQFVTSHVINKLLTKNKNEKQNKIVQSQQKRKNKSIQNLEKLFQGTKNNHEQSFVFN